MSTTETSPVVSTPAVVESTTESTTSPTTSVPAVVAATVAPVEGEEGFEEEGLTLRALVSSKEAG